MLKKGGLLLIVIFTLCSIRGIAQILSSPDSWYNPLQEEVIEYNASTGSYYFYKLLGGRKTVPYKILSAEEFGKFQQESAMREEWIARRSSSNEGVNRGTRGGLIPSMRVDSDLFGQIFGGNEITITPQGSVEAIFGVNYTKNDNPMIPSEYRSSTSFDFDTKLQFNISGNIGERLKLNFNYDTEATFDFDQEVKLQYVGQEDDILQKLEAGNVSLPLSGSLITGSQSLFGIKTELKFGKLTFTGLVSQQRSESKEVTIQGGAQNRTFEIAIDEYDANRHFFLSQVFYDSYDKALEQLPLIRSGINITKIEVWVTNKTNQFDNSRSLVAFLDMAEPYTLYDQSLQNAPTGTYPKDDANRLFGAGYVDKTQLRNANNITSYLTTLGYTGGSHYEKLENARKLTQGSDYVLNEQLGYISLTTALNSDEVLAVAYEYTYNGVAHKVGELSTDGIISPNTLVLKLLKGTNFSPKLPNWKLMMKNVYNLDAYQISKDNFLLDIYYQDSQAGTALPYITEGNIANQPLIRALHLDNLNSQNDAYPDGVFDFVEGVTVITSQGKIIFPVREPFGRYLESKIGNTTIADKYTYKELYDSTLTKAKELAEKNKFTLIGSYQSDVASEIYLNATNIPEGSVIVTAGSARLVENIDYIVNYTMGTVQIINTAYLESGTPIKVSMEDRGLFNVMRKTMYGAHLNYEFNKDFNIGATVLGLHERPLTQKLAYGDDPISNIMWGMNLSYRTESDFLTNMVNKIPFINTRAPSYLNIDAEFAQLLPGQSGSANGKTYIDDFDGTQTSMDLRSYLAWHLSSTPSTFGESRLSDNLQYGYRRSKLAWYTISTDFTRNTSATPGYVRGDRDRYLGNHFVREIPIKEIYPNRDILVGTSNYLTTLNLAYYPTVRGPYNYQTSQTKVNTDGYFTNPGEQWGGMMRSLTETDFEAANYEYIEFWLMDPFVYNTNGKGGDLYINLGNISEDILKDGHKQYENGLPYPFDAAKVVKTVWGHVPKAPSVTYAFDNNFAAREWQDVGFDGLNDASEAELFSDFLTDLNFLTPAAKDKIINDPSSDNYRYYFDSYFNANPPESILDAYADFNGPNGNSRNTGEMSTPNPDAEDLNKDNTMNEVESYYQYRIRISPQDLVLGQNYIEDKKESEAYDKDGGRLVTWYQFKIPIAEYERAVGDIADFKSIRFMRVFLTNFQDTTYLRFASFNLVRSEWRRYSYSLIEGQEGLAQPETGNAQFDVSVVNIEENSNRYPINYVMPPGTTREVDPSTYQENELNEQSMQLKVLNLGDGEARAAYKSSLFDFRKFRRMQMDIHAESVQGQPALKNGDVSLFIRMGSDYRNNYYEYEIPLEISPWEVNEQLSVWLEENFMDLELERLTNLKIERNQYIKNSGGSTGTLYETTTTDGHKYRILGNPTLGTIRNVMVGIRNPAKTVLGNDDGLDKSVIVWVNELRLTDVDNKGGWAANARIATTLADFGSVSVSGNIKTAGFGSLESRISDRLLNDTYQYDIISNFELGKFFPDRFGVKIPMFFGFSEYYETPYYNPYDQDVKLKDVLSSLSSQHEKDSLKRITQSLTRRKSFSLNNIRVMPEGGMPQVFSISNFSVSYAFNETYSRNMNTLNNTQKNFSGSLGYNYDVQAKFWQPFKNVKGQALAFIRDFNIGLYPKRFSFNTEMSRYYSEMQSRSVYYPDIEIPATYAKDFTWNRSYMFMYDLARSLSVTFSATNLARIDEPEGMVNESKDPEGYRHWRREVWKSVRDFGRNIQYNQDISVSWQVPFNKIRPLNWISSSITYNTSYEWVAAPILADGSQYEPGNTISNMQNMIINGNLNFASLYNKSSYLRSVNNRFDGTGPKRDYGYKEVKHQVPRVNFFANRRRVVKHNLGTTVVTTAIYDSDGNEVKGDTRVIDRNNVEITFPEEIRNARVAIVGQIPRSQNVFEFTGELLLRIAMSVRSVGITYNEMNTSTLSGFMPKSSVFGQSQNDGWAPGWDFIFGKQDDSFVEKARRKGWLTTEQTFISPYTMTEDKTLNVHVELEPVKDFRVTLSGFRTYNNADSRYTIVDPDGARQATGRFSISIVSIGSAFESPKATNGFKSASYDKFLANREKVAWLYANDRSGKSASYVPGVDAYPDGYGQFNQQVLIGTFLSAYAGRSVGDNLFDDFPSFPMPNWDVAYTGLSRIEALKPFIRSATLRHSYTSRYSINSFTLNSTFGETTQDGLSTVRNALNDFIAYRDISNVAIREDMAPFIQVDLGFQNNLLLEFATNRRRLVSLSLANNQITENRVKEYVAGIGYTFDKVPILFNIDRSRGENVSSLTLRMNFQYSDDLSIIRRLDESDVVDESDIFNQLSDGRDVMTLGFRADYRISDKVNMGLFFNRVLTEPYVSAIKTTNSNFGLSVRILFTQ